MRLDQAVFKMLAHNDTGAAAGHQGGIVIPKDIARFFPPLANTTSSINPTVDVRLKADLFIDGVRIGSVLTRYQHQTWGGKRSPERRLTDNLGPLRNVAEKDDILVFVKDLDDDAYIQLRLLRKGTDEYNRLYSSIGEKRWGLVDPSRPPVSWEELTEAEHYLEEKIVQPADAFDTKRKITHSGTIHRARNRAFRRKILEIYDSRCAFTGRRFASPLSEGLVGLDAAHIIPVSSHGSDHPANGIPLTKELHWSFDQGLIGVSTSRTIIVPNIVKQLAGNEFLCELDGVQLREAHVSSLRALDTAFEWHRRHVLIV